ncbi:SpoIIAA family protein [Aureibacter tunicatorum]|uniref:STAS/SEC14 domain-containing protein n=1 Tax=Aureibacter tunicatorum TaxID=866807 RepID=A0AAE4BTG5_9BACT|nr:STAS/SEC14 domain-containing protein [Aureibacter tunicatorum]MDR6239562.1 hypothetical protein [Aureibacter tunicatorum]BDD04039.1 hypothetical protein AUTU_15220 [Aureibacter tunicatorum]
MLKQLESKKENVIAFELSGKVEMSFIREFIQLVKPKLEAGDGLVNIFMKINNADWDNFFHLKSFVMHDWPHIMKEFNQINSDMKKLNKIAVVGSSDFEKQLVQVDSFFGKIWYKGIEEKYFDVSEEEEAWKFVS